MSLVRVAAARLVWTGMSLVILTLLFGVIGLVGEGLQQSTRQLAGLRKADKTLPAIAAEEVGKAQARIRQLRGQAVGALRARQEEIDSNLAQYTGVVPVRDLPAHEVALLAASDKLVPRLRTELEVELWKQERSYLDSLIQAADFRSLGEQLKELERLRAVTYKEVEVEERKFRAAQAEMGWAERLFGRAYETRLVKGVNAARDRYHTAILKDRALYDRIEELRASQAKHAGRAPPESFSPALEGAKGGARQALSTATVLTQEAIDASWLHRVAETFAPYAAAAANVLAYGIVLYLAWKWIAYFIVAPLAAKRPPIRLEPASTTPAQSTPMRASAVTLRLVLSSEQELLVKDGYLQDSPATARASTRLLLNAAYPLASFASGMHGLTCILGDGAGGAVTVSSIIDPLDELAQVSLSATSGFVLLPRYLVGVVQDARNPIRIQSVWRLASVHAWLTFQFRYLVFHGPGSVIVKGCRGVRIERPDAQRRIAQTATVGFSASLAYSTGRTETFLPYLLGVKSLFNDSFQGQGFYAYQEVAVPRSGSRVEGRLMGLLDVLLRPFGI